MSATSSNTSFFSFGPENSFVSKSFERLRYRNLPPSLHDLIIGGSVLDVHWATLGPVPQSWVLSFKDTGGKNNLGWGSSTPERLKDVLSTLTPSPHFRSFLGPLGSFVAWDPTFIRWTGLPSCLEDTFQSWLTPSGWKAGPPRLATWGLDDAFFAISEYGDVAYRLGSEGGEETWPIFKETVEEWRAERRFSWDELSYLSLDSTTPDQFIAIRSNGTWAGSIDDSNEDALEAFTLNFFARSKPKSKAKPPPKSNGYHHQQASSTIPRPEETTPDAATQALYEKWATETASVFASALAARSQATPSPPTNAKGTPARPRAPKKLQIRSQSSRAGIPATSSTSSNAKLLTTFPHPPAALTTCALPACTPHKSDPAGLRACKHDVERLLRASGLYSYEWLRQERIRWHPDRFGRLCEESWREEGRRLAEEMFKIIDSLITDLDRMKGA